MLPRIDGAHRMSHRLPHGPSHVVSYLAVVIQRDWLRPVPTLVLLLAPRLPDISRRRKISVSMPHAASPLMSASHLASMYTIIGHRCPSVYFQQVSSQLSVAPMYTGRITGNTQREREFSFGVEPVVKRMMSEFLRWRRDSG